MRRLLAISLLMLFGLPFVLPLFGTSAAEASVPICCRRDGKHHCMMDMTSTQNASTRTVGEKCPYSVTPPAILVLPSFAPSTAAAVFAEATHHPASFPQVEAQYRISFDHARQKRGPPLQIV